MAGEGISKTLNLKIFSGSRPPDSPRFGAALALAFLPLRAPLRSHSTLLTSGILYHEINVQGWKKRNGLYWSRRGWKEGWGGGGGGGESGSFKKLLLPRG